jgi:hypothetical protein
MSAVPTNEVTKQEQVTRWFVVPTLGQEEANRAHGLPRCLRPTLLRVSQGFHNVGGITRDPNDSRLIGQGHAFGFGAEPDRN